MFALIGRGERTRASGPIEREVRRPQRELELINPVFLLQATEVVR